MGYWDFPTLLRVNNQFYKLRTAIYMLNRFQFVHNFEGINTMKFVGIDRQKNY